MFREKNICFQRVDPWKFRGFAGVLWFCCVSFLAALSGNSEVLISEDFDGSGALNGRTPGINQLSPGKTWIADEIFSASGEVDDGDNTDRGAWLDLGEEFVFLPNQTYTLELGWRDLANSILFAGFMKDAPNAAGQMQTQSTNFALRARRIASGDRLAAWKNPGASAVSGETATPAEGTAMLTLETRDLSNATFSVSDLAAAVPIDLSGGFRYLWLGYEDPTSGASNVVFTSVTLSGPLPVPPSEPEPIGTPNLLLIVGSGVLYGDLQSYGGVNIATPALDSLAYDGIRFTQFATTGPGTAASQYALFTGRVAARSGMGESVSPAASGWQAEEWTLAEVLRKRGYETGFVGEWQLGNAPGSHPNDQGFQLFYGFPYLQSANPPLAENQQTLEEAPDSAQVFGKLVARAKTFITSTPQPFALVFQPPSLPAAGSSIAGETGNRIEALDQAVAQLLSELESTGKSANTLVIFLGDGGAENPSEIRTNGLFRDGPGTTWEGGMRVPLLARLPGTLPAGQINLSPIWLPDLMPTIASLVGGRLALDRKLDGTARHSALSGISTRPTGSEKAFGFRFSENAYRLASVRSGKWKTHRSIVNIDPLNTNPTTGAQLYDLHIDAEERINRATQQPAVLSQLEDLAADLNDELPAPGTTDLPAPKPAVIDDVTSSIEHSGAATSVQFAFVRPVDSLDDDYFVQNSSDLVTWQTLPITPFVDSLDPHGENREKLKLRVPLDTDAPQESRQFVRLGYGRAVNP